MIFFGLKIVPKKVMIMMMITAKLAGIPDFDMCCQRALQTPRPRNQALDSKTPTTKSRMVLGFCCLAVQFILASLENFVSIWLFGTSKIIVE